MKAITYYTPDGEAYSLFDNETSWLAGYVGFGGIAPQVVGDPTPYRDGVYHRGMWLPPRELAVVIWFKADSLSELRTRERALRHGLSPFRNRTTAGTLRVITDDEEVRCLRVFPVAYEDNSEQFDTPYSARRTFVFVARDDPFWYDPEAEEVEATLTEEGSVTFPITFPVTFGSVNIDQTLNVSNAGDVETYPVIVVTGPGSDPRVDNETVGWYIDCAGLSMDEDDTLTIDCGNGTIEFYDASEAETSVPDITSGSSFGALAIGDNAMRFRLTNGIGASMSLTAYVRYWGV